MTREATIPQNSVNRLLFSYSTMERTRPADRSNLIRVSMLLFSVLAIVSFSLAHVAW